jgi:endonuclease YncB( thermonuclease family)
MIVAVSKYSAAALVAATVIIAGESSIFLPPQFETVDDVPSRYFIEDRVVYGRVERAIDGDTVRIRHCRYSFYCEDRMKKVTSLGGSRLISLEPPKRIYDSTLSIRLYGVDCPEIQKRKNDPPSQPFGDVAKEYISNSVLGKKVKVTLLSKDRYGRAIGKVETPRKFILFGRKDLSIELIRRGLATLYTGGGAEYSNNLDILKSKQAEAQKEKRGIWSLGKDMISPAEFKRKQRHQRSHQQKATTITTSRVDI